MGETGSGGSAEILVEGFATDPQVTGDDGLSLAVINTAVQLGDHFVGEGTFPPAISTALSGDRNAFALPLPDQGALEFGERTHDREHQVGHRGILAREGQAFLHELDPDASFGEGLNQFAQIVEITRQSIHAVDHDGVTVDFH